MVVCFGVKLITLTPNGNALPRIRLDGGLCLCRPALSPRSILVGFVVRKVSVGQGLLRVLRCFALIIISGMYRDAHSPAPYGLPVYITVQLHVLAISKISVNINYV
jgi:hypothetical protein